jgi:hypothetical protein
MLYYKGRARSSRRWRIRPSKHFAPQFERDARLVPPRCRPAAPTTSADQGPQYRRFVQPPRHW